MLGGEISVGDVVTLILGGSLFGGVGSLVTARGLARKAKAEGAIAAEKAPIEKTALAVQTSDAALLGMQRVADANERRALAAEARNIVLEQEREEDRQLIEQLQRQVAELQTKAERAVKHAAEAREDARLLQERLQAMARHHDERNPHQHP